MLQVATDNADIPAEKDFVKWIDNISQEIDLNIDNITIRVVDIDEIQTLNCQFRNQDKPTNVLSFPAQLPEVAEDDYLGDIIICAEIVEQEAIRDQKTVISHWAHMVVHGVLHLCGYDHIEKRDAVRMEALEIKILDQMGFTNPYQ